MACKLDNMIFVAQIDNIANKIIETIDYYVLVYIVYTCDIKKQCNV